MRISLRPQTYSLLGRHSLAPGGLESLWASLVPEKSLMRLEHLRLPRVARSTMCDTSSALSHPLWAASCIAHCLRASF
jgi:hypothetical protein